MKGVDFLVIIYSWLMNNGGTWRLYFSLIFSIFLFHSRSDFDIVLPYIRDCLQCRFLSFLTKRLCTDNILVAACQHITLNGETYCFNVDVTVFDKFVCRLAVLNMLWIYNRKRCPATRQVQDQALHDESMLPNIYMPIAMWPDHWSAVFKLFTLWRKAYLCRKWNMICQPTG